MLDAKIDASERLVTYWRGDLPGGVVVLEGVGYQEDQSHNRTNVLYHSFITGSDGQHPVSKVKLTDIPIMPGETAESKACGFGFHMQKSRESVARNFNAGRFLDQANPFLPE